MPSALKPKSFTGSTRHVHRLGYYLYLPTEYNRAPKKKWPVILFLHGAGERGTNLRKILKHGPPKLIKDGRHFPFVVVSPQCPRGQTWSDEALLSLVDDIIHRHRVDARRIYLTGLSMGGYGTWSLGLKHPERFAAIAPICGGGEIVSLLLAEGKRLKRLKALPVWAFHGAKDNVVRPSESERMVHALRELGNDPKLTIYPEAEHDSWSETYENPALYEWFLQHRSPGR